MDIFKTVTDRMVAEMEQGIIPWRKPWMAAGVAVSHVSGKAYSCLNQMLLGRAGEFLTYHQVQQEGGYVRRGEKASQIVFWKWLEKTDDGTGEIIRIPFLRYISVFSTDQCHGITARYTCPNPNPAHPDQIAESIITGYVQREGVTIEHRDVDAAFYQPSKDLIVLPHIKQFTEAAEYYGVVYHEMAHSTGNMKRLARIDNTASFGSETYSKEELIAEIASATLVHYTGLETSSSFKNSTAYVQNWLQALKNDKRLIVSAAGQAERAASLILGKEADPDVGTDE